MSEKMGWQVTKSPPLNPALLSEPKLEKKSSLREWHWVYLEQEAAFLSGKYKKDVGTKNKVKNTGKKPANRIIKPKYIISSPRSK